MASLDSKYSSAIRYGSVLVEEAGHERARRPCRSPGAPGRAPCRSAACAGSKYAGLERLGVSGLPVQRDVLDHVTLLRRLRRRTVIVRETGHDSAVRIILLRHAESLGNVDELAYTRTPDHALPLTARGEVQATAAGPVVRGLLARSGGRVRQSVRAGVENVRAARRDQPNGWCRSRGCASRTGATCRTRWSRRWRSASGTSSGTSSTGYPTASRAPTSTTAWRPSSTSWSYESRKDPSHPDTVLVVSHGLTMRLLCRRMFSWSIDLFESLSNPQHCADPNAGPRRQDWRLNRAVRPVAGLPGRHHPGLAEWGISSPSAIPTIERLSISGGLPCVHGWYGRAERANVSSGPWKRTAPAVGSAMSRTSPRQRLAQTCSLRSRAESKPSKKDAPRTSPRDCGSAQPHERGRHRRHAAEVLTAPGNRPILSDYLYDAGERDHAKRHRCRWMGFLDVPRTRVKQDLSRWARAPPSARYPDTNGAWRLNEVMPRQADQGPSWSARSVGTERHERRGIRRSPRAMSRSKPSPGPDFQPSDRELRRPPDGRSRGGYSRSRHLPVRGLTAGRRRAWTSSPAPVFLGLTPPKIVIQVEVRGRRRGTAGRAAVAGAIATHGADHGLLVAWGGITREAREDTSPLNDSLSRCGSRRRARRTVPVLPSPACRHSA